MWRSFVDSSEPDLEPMGPLASSLGLETADTPEGLATAGLGPGGFLTILLVKVLCEDKLLAALQRCVHAGRAGIHRAVLCCVCVCVFL